MIIFPAFFELACVVSFSCTQIGLCRPDYKSKDSVGSKHGGVESELLPHHPELLESYSGSVAFRTVNVQPS